jgi:hypothetical protein
VRSKRQDCVSGTEGISWLHESCSGIYKSGTVKCGLATHNSVFMHSFNEVVVYYSNKIKGHEMGRGCGMHRKEYL